MSDVIPETGVCRIVIESIDKDDDYCLDNDAESEIDPSETSNVWEEDKFQLEYRNNTVCCWKERKNRVVNTNACSFDSECDEDDMKTNKFPAHEHYNGSEERPLLQTVPDLSNMVDENLLENDSNTIRKSFSNQHQSNSFEDIEFRVPEIHTNCIVNSKSYMEMTDAVRRLKEVLALPINQREQKSEFIERENTDGAISTEKTNTCSSTLVCFGSYSVTNPLENYPSPERNCSTTILTDNFRPTATYEPYNTNLENSSHNSRSIQKEENKEVEFTKDSDDTLDFNMAVEALNLLKSKGRTFPNLLADFNETQKTIPATFSNTSNPVEAANEPSLPVSTIETYSTNEPFSFCSSTEKNNSHLLFDSTLEITDCTTGATIPFESFYKCNNDLLTADENESSNESQTENGIIPTKLTQLSDIVTSVKIPLSVSSDRDKESQNKEINYRYSAYQVEPGKPNSNTLTDTSLTISKGYSAVLPEIETNIRKEHELKEKSTSGHKRKSKTKEKAEDEDEDESKLQYKPQSSITSSITPEDYKNDHRSSPKILTKRLCVEPKKKEFNEELEEFKLMLENRRASQTSKTPDCSFEHFLQHSSSITQNNISSMNGNSLDKNEQYFENSQIKDRILNAFFSSPSKPIEVLNQTPQRPANENANGNLDYSNTPQFSEEKQIAEKLQTLAIIEKIRTPVDAFSLIITDGIIRKIVKYTNEKLMGTSMKPTIVGYKKPTNDIELKSFLGLLLISAALRQNNAKVAELWSECFGASIYRATIQEGRFNIFLQNLCFGDDTPSTGVIGKSEVFQTGDPWEEYHQNCKKYPLAKIETKCHSTSKEEDIKQQFTSVRKTTNLHLSVLFSMLDTAIIRGTAIYRNKYPKSGMRIRTFFKDVGMALVKPQLEEKLMRPTTASCMKELIKRILCKKPKTCSDYFISVTDQPLKKVKRCQLCSWNKDRKTRHHCLYCKRSMCREHRARLCIDCINIM